MPLAQQHTVLIICIIVDVVLLIVLFWRRPWRHITRPTAIFLLGCIMLQAGRLADIRFEMFEEYSDPEIRAMNLLLLAAGMMLIPSAILHIALRILDSGVVNKDSWDIRYFPIYLPMLALIPIGRNLTENSSTRLINHTTIAPYLTPFIAWLSIVTLTAIVSLWMQRKTVSEKRIVILSTIQLVVLSLALALFVSVVTWENYEQNQNSLSVLFLILSPTLPAAIYAAMAILHDPKEKNL